MRLRIWHLSSSKYEFLKAGIASTLGARGCFCCNCAGIASISDIVLSGVESLTDINAELYALDPTIYHRYC